MDQLVTLEDAVHPGVQPSTFKVHAGDRLLFCTDGLLEGHAIGPAATSGPSTAWTRCVTQTFRQPRNGPPDRLTAHAGRKLDDDVALLLLEIAPVPAGTEQRPAAASGPQAVLGRQR